MSHEYAIADGAARRSRRELLWLAHARMASHPSPVDADGNAAVRELIGHISDDTIAKPEGEGPRAAPGFIDALRNAVLDIVAEGDVRVDARDLAQVLRAIERTAARASPDSRGAFANYLTSADSVSALIEIAHDMRSPLTSILFLVDTLRLGQSGPVTTVQERQLGLIYGAALGLNSLACDVIDAVRGGHGLVDGPPVPFSICDVVMGVCDTVRPISEEKGLPIEQSLRAIDGRVGYPAALGRVLLNLMTNALKYTNRGTVSVGCNEVTPARVSFYVRDTGEGIPPHVMAMLYDGFRPSASGMRFSNAGLGLAICQSFLSSMGSRLKVDSVREQGTAFSFEVDLPRA